MTTDDLRALLAALLSPVWFPTMLLAIALLFVGGVMLLAVDRMRGIQ